MNLEEGAQATVNVARSQNGRSRLRADSAQWRRLAVATFAGEDQASTRTALSGLPLDWAKNAQPEQTPTLNTTAPPRDTPDGGRCDNVPVATLRDDVVNAFDLLIFGTLDRRPCRRCGRTEHKEEGRQNPKPGHCPIGVPFLLRGCKCALQPATARTAASMVPSANERSSRWLSSTSQS